MKTTKFTGLILTIALAPLVVSAAEQDRGRADRLPNILFIVSDDHGWGDLPSNWDKTEVRLPTLEALAAQGCPVSELPYRPALRTVSRLHVYRSILDREWYVARPRQQPLGSPGYRGIKRDVKMLSEHLAEAGYKTGAFGKWHMGSLEGEVPNDRGFDEFRGFLRGASLLDYRRKVQDPAQSRAGSHLRRARDRVVHRMG